MLLLAHPPCGPAPLPTGQVLAAPLGHGDQSHCRGWKSQGTEVPAPVMSLSSRPRAGLPTSRLLLQEKTNPSLLLSLLIGLLTAEHIPNGDRFHSGRFQIQTQFTIVRRSVRSLLR